MKPILGDCAVVLGGSLAGLLTARVLAKRFSTVVVVERDRLPDVPASRRGVPQGNHIHGLLAGGQRAMEQLLPGLVQELAAAGVPVGDPLADLRIRLNGHRFRQAPSGLTLVSASRDVLEHQVRQRVRSQPGLKVMDRCDVVGLAGGGDRLSGVRVLRRADDSVEELLDADVVVDATGRGSRAPVWLSDIGIPPPKEEQLRIDLGYTTRRYRLPLDALEGGLGVLQAPTPRHPRGAALAHLEDGVWMLTLIGLRGDHPPVRVEDFDRFAESVGSDDISSLIAMAEPIDSPVAFRFPASRRRYYERTRLPVNMLVVGDSLCSFNPVYGQGMSVAALEAVAIARKLAGGKMVPSRVVMGELARIIDVPWRMTGGVDRAFLPAEKAPRRDRIMAAYVDRVQAAAEHDSVVGRGFLRVSGMIDPPGALLRPSLMWRTLRRPFTAPAACPDPYRRRKPPSI